MKIYELSERSFDCLVNESHDVILLLSTEMDAAKWNFLALVLKCNIFQHFLFNRLIDKMHENMTELIKRVDSINWISNGMELLNEK